MKHEIKIYVADLAAYNAGHLHGVWIDATLDVEDIQKQIDALLANSRVVGAEEFSIHDHEGFGEYGIGEHTDIETAHEVAMFIVEHQAFGSALLNHFGGDLEDAKRAAEDNYCGCHKSLADYAQELTEETTQIPENLRHYIDYEAMARDMEAGGDVFTVETGFQEVHVFWNH